MIKIIIGIGIMDYAVSLFFVMTGYRLQGRAPIFASDQVVTNMVDPLPQAACMAAIVVALSTTLILIALAIRLYEKYGTFDITEIKRLKG